MVLFDVQPDQREAVLALLHKQNQAVLDEAPIITMRLSQVKGRTVEEMLADRRKSIPNWALRREYRSTYNDRLRDGEKLLAGQWHAHATNATAVVPVSVEQGIAEELQVGLGDELVFDVQGVPMRTRVASLREVDWRRVQPNFFVVFPRGVLEEAPAFHVLVTKVASAERSAVLQRLIVERFPNVSVIDLTLVLQTVDSVLSKIAFVIRFMALFTVLTGLFVLAATVLTGRYQRIRESVLLRTLGASRAQVRQILVVEYLSLGALAALTGILLAVAGSWALAAFVFEVRFAPSWLPIGLALAVVSGLTVLTGLLASRGVLTHPPLAVLREEG
jgi:putative ABC transport system permease protein